jgi:hypothetical protein
MWRNLVKRLCPDAEFSEPATSEAMASAERALSVELPRQLRALLSETDGVIGSYGLDVIWSIERIVQDNLAFRSNRDFHELYMPFDPLLFFGDDGGGDQFAYVILAGVIRNPFDIFRWEHETDSRTWFAFTLEQYLEHALQEEAEPESGPTLSDTPPAS